MSWTVTPTDPLWLPSLEVHVHPTVDTREHRLGPFCWCGPRPEWAGAGLVWVHRARIASAAAGRVGRD